MSNITKNLLLALSLVCAIALIVFCIQLIVINRGVEPREPGATISGGAKQGDKEPDTDNQPDGEDSADGENSDGENSQKQNTPRPPPQGERNELAIPGDLKLIVYAREELFEYTKNDFNWRFEYTREGEAALEIRLILVSLQGIASDAETFLMSYAEGATPEPGDEVSFQGFSLEGYNVTAQRGNVTYEALVHPLPDDEFALVFVINYQNDQQKDALYEILYSIDLLTPQLT